MVRAPRLPERARPVVDVGAAMAAAAQAHRVTGLAAEIAFFALLSLFPTLVALAAALGSLEVLVGRDVAAEAETAVLDFLRRVLTDEADEVVDAARELFGGGHAGVLTMGAAGAVWAASRGFAAVIDALGVVYELEERRSWLRRRAIALVLVLGSVVTGAVLLAAVVLGPLLGRGQDVADAIGVGATFAAFWDWGRWPVMAAVMVAWAATVFHVAPDHRTPWRWDLPGAALAAALWVVASAGLRLYLALAGGANQVLGALGGTLVVVLWLYVLGLALLLGAELNAELAARARATGVTGRRPAPAAGVPASEDEDRAGRQPDPVDRPPGGR
jgi:membrane protein